ncbi:DUF317 domain-containing protein [Streptomyces sp. B15]|uniref:DUF317 domain-containing protein n=1 Tax=Streptomyces sp. B15 TaxID=1537797 RepID=UPI001B37CC46|nr:DUF317 domain-containing protein [Streptomyces sp. B15]MBQ1123774.1 DUF317 domain-containing protein [Streptomyces sp. B15]
MHPQNPTPADRCGPAPYMVKPRYLAGPCDQVPVITGSNWQQQRVPGLGTAYLRCDEATGSHYLALHTPGTEEHPARLACDGMPVGWEFLGYPAAGHLPSWRVIFSPGTPPELPAALAGLLSADEEPAPHEVTDAGEATAPLEAAGWIRDLGHECSWFSPGDQQAAVVTPTSPANPTREEQSWLLAARNRDRDEALWLTQATPQTPTALIRALCAQLADPAPVPRHREPGTGPVTVIRP